MDFEHGIKPVKLLNAYKAREDVRCSFCQARQLHRRGFTVLMPNGTKALCGKDCAERFFELTAVANLDRKLTADIKISTGRKVIDSLVAKIPELMACLEKDLIPLEKTLEEAINDLKEFIPRSYVKSNISEAGMLEFPKGVVRGARAFDSTRNSFRIARGGLNSILTNTSNPTELLEKGKLEELQRKRTGVKGAIEKGLDDLAFASRFFESRNLAEFKRWLKHTKRDHGVTEFMIVGHIIHIENSEWENDINIPKVDMKNCRTIMKYFDV